MAYPYYPNTQFYMNDLQNMRDRIDAQMKQLQQQQTQIQQPAPITQNFQIAPQNNNNNDLEGKFAENYEEVKNTFVIKTGLFVNKNYTTLWVKDVSGNIKTFSLQEIVELDEKDREILDLQRQVNELRGVIENAKSVNTDVDEPITNKKSTRVSSSTKSNAK